MKVVVQQVDMDTCLTALIRGVTCHDTIVAVQGDAAPSDLADPAVLCIEAGGSGEVVRNNFDHHNTTILLPPACRQAWLLSPCDDGTLARLVDYVAALDVGGRRALPPLPEPRFPTLSAVFSGMRLTVSEPTPACLSEEALLRYVTGTLVADVRPVFEAHLSSCLYCLARSAEVHTIAEAARQRRCAWSVPRLHAYLTGQLADQEREAVRTHLLVCEDCFARYEQLVEAQMEDEWEAWSNEDLPAVKPLVTETTLGRLTHFPALRPRFRVSELPLAARPRSDTAPSATNWQQFEIENLTVTFTLDMHDHLLMTLQSAHYDVSQVTVSLCHQRDDVTVVVRSAVTNTEGQADFGSIASLPIPEQEAYIIVLAGPTASAN